MKKKVGNEEKEDQEEKKEQAGKKEKLWRLQNSVWSSQAEIRHHDGRVF